MPNGSTINSIVELKKEYKQAADNIEVKGENVCPAHEALAAGVKMLLRGRVTELDTMIIQYKESRNRVWQLFLKMFPILCTSLATALITVFSLAATQEKPENESKTIDAAVQELQQGLP